MGERPVEARAGARGRTLRPTPESEASARDVQSVFARAVARLAEGTGCDRVAAWTARESGEPYVVAASYRGEPPLTPSREALAALVALDEATDLGRPEIAESLRKLGETHGFSAAAPIESAAEAPPAVLLLGDPRDPRGGVRPRTLAALGATARGLAPAVSAAVAMTRLRHLDQEVRRLDRLARLGDLLAEVAHELRNPLVSIKTFLQLLPDRVDEPEFRTRFLGVVAEELRRMERLLDSVIAHARPPATDGSAAPVAPVLHDVAQLLRYRAAQLEITIEVEAEATLPDVDMGEDALRQVVLNLVLNALDATPEGGAIRLRAMSTDEGVEIAVEDEGPGVPESQRGRIFEPFFSTHPERPGGLGLSISQRMVEEAGGRIALSDRPGGGAVFRLLLPGG